MTEYESPQAVLRLYKLYSLNKKEVRSVVAWLRDKADEIETSDLSQYSDQFTARIWLCPRY